MLKHVLPTLLAATLVGCAADSAVDNAETSTADSTQVAWRVDLPTHSDTTPGVANEEAAVIAALRGAGLSPIMGAGDALSDWGLTPRRRQVDHLGNLHIRLGLVRGDINVEGMGLNTRDGQSLVSGPCIGPLNPVLDSGQSRQVDRLADYRM